MNANDQFFARDAHVDAAAIAALPNSRKIHVVGSRADIRVPMREITQSDTPASSLSTEGAEKNPALVVYDTSGPYTDPAASIDIRAGLPALRAQWIEDRHDTEALPQLSSAYGRERLAEPELAGMRFDLHRLPRRARTGANLSGNVTQMHYARRGIVTPEMEFVAIRENLQREQHARGHARTRDAPASGPELRRSDSGIHHARVRPQRSRPRPRDHPQQHQSPGIRADDHRPQFPREDQRQHRQLGGVVVDRGRSRQDDLGDPLGRRYGDGSLDRQEHPRDARVDHPQFAGADRDGAHLSGAGEGGRQGGGAHLGDVPRHTDRAGRAGRRLLHHPRRRACCATSR